MLSVTLQARPCYELLEDYEKNKRVFRAAKLEFSSMAGRDVYNVSVPLLMDGAAYIAGRAETRASEISEVVFFRKTGRFCTPVCPPAPFPLLQDPFLARIRGEIVFGGVRLKTDPRDPQKIAGYRTEFYRGSTIRDLRPFAAGPEHMKDIRLVQLSDGTVGIFTRPQGNGAGKGKVGFTRVDRLEDVTREAILGAEIIPSLFTEDEWGGVNNVHLLKNGLLGVIGHIAYMSRGMTRHYFPAAFAFNPETLEYTPVKIICRRSDVLDAPAKRPDLKDVLFPGGIVRKGERADLYVGVSDATAQCVEIGDPFLEYEA